MIDFFKTLKNKLSLQSNEIVPEAQSMPVTDTADDQEDGDHRVGNSTETAVPGQIDTLGSAKNVLMPDIYADRYEPTEPLLKILDPATAEVDESTGFNPYDTAVLKKK